MTSKGNGQSPQYDVIMSEQTKAKLKQLHMQALLRGTGQQFLDAFRQLSVRHGVIAPLIVDYAVHESRPLVFISGFKALS